MQNGIGFHQQQRGNAKNHENDQTRTNKTSDISIGILDDTTLKPHTDHGGYTTEEEEEEQQPRKEEEIEPSDL